MDPTKTTCSAAGPKTTLMWGGEGDDEFYYGEGMGRDEILDFNKKDDEVIFDEDLYDTFRQLRKDVKLKNDKVVVKVDSDDQLTIYGIDTLKDLKKVVAFDDFTDLSRCGLMRAGNLIAPGCPLNVPVFMAPVWESASTAGVICSGRMGPSSPFSSAP